MLLKIKKTKILTGCLLLLAVNTYAADSAAVYFAKQAGVIAGAAEACGQPVSTMVIRSGEVIDALKTDSSDKTYALAAFQQAQQESQKNEVQSQMISCPKVISDYNNLPLMQPDYQEKVIKPLLSSVTTPAGMTPAATQPNAASTSGVAQPVTAAPAPTTGTLPPALQNALPGTNAPTQNYVQGTPVPTPSNPAGAAGMNPYAAPPINPAYGGAIPANTPGTNPNQATEVQRLQLAQQFAQMAQTLVLNGQPPVAAGYGQPSVNNPNYNPQLNEQLNGMGANNPIFTGAPLNNPQ